MKPTPAPLLTVCLALFAAGCQLGPGVHCSEDVTCSPWGRCGAQGVCLVMEADGGAGPWDSGASTRQAVVTSETSLTFGDDGLVPCDTQAPARSFTLRNDSRQTLNLTYALSGSPSAYQVNLPETVAEGATVMVKVTPLKVPRTADTSPDFFAETLTVRATGGVIDVAHAIALHLTAQGARLTFNPTALTFSALSPAVYRQDFRVENTGNAPATFSLSTDGRFSLLSSWGAVAAGQQLTRSVTFTPSQDPGLSTEAIGLSTNATLCAPLPPDLLLAGTSR